ncbi:MAG TPA: hypothetical protein DEE98_01265 [Elusimicrobia bacterium]|nr:MAG: hypothetical protein A2278_03960 [Elusimicrobia bacterium RIFOXYA12_FULL_49_49]OGS10086.1 MAG: hypothetical protein A2204_07980 [Elusimicrobia bacterium RIFOXYA1_FULL_47_7]OGS11724.1 MAG: hypothetical protein A2386_02355 [Elusimicrobia bacterium RIFOXYB1_FULL_48_9]OGS15314.1 MAG: hypothetical protein A2251_07275 [Elusimicrobia bacterium RIFOXYA2_FULL_47_53]OGS26532.1 MAG: hypothetical protein A2339_06845 [Elusimicrobia bacterium RIFOXYB12_FULL_50_12]OGS30569.1 MAG: hypothetical protein
MISFPSFIVENNWFWIIALIVVLYFTIRGYLWQTIYEDRNVTLDENTKEAISKFKRIYVFRIQDALYNGICSFSGFVALYTEAKIIIKIIDYSRISLGTTTFLIFLTLISICGISGVIPRLLHLGKLPGQK